MPIRGWYARYSELLKEFGYLKSTDTKAAKILNEIIKKPVPENKFRRLIAGKTVFVIGAGPSLNQTIQTARKMKATKIVADSAVKAALKAGIIPDIVLTDLDGDADALQKAANSGSLMLVHAHGDNMDALPAVKKFVNAAASTQGKPMGHVQITVDFAAIKRRNLFSGTGFLIISFRIFAAFVSVDFKYPNSFNSSEYRAYQPLIGIT